MASPRRLVAPVALLLLTAAPPAAEAEGAEARDDAFEAARARFEEGLARVRREEWAAALDLFDQSLALHATSVAHYNRAQCLRMLGRDAEAANAFEAYLERYAGEVDGSRRAEVEAELARLDRLVGRLEVEVEPAEGAEVLVDGDRAGRTPLSRPLALGPGPHEVEVRAAGFAPVRRRLEVSAGSRASVVVTLSPLGSVGAIAVEASVPGATLLLDGEEVGTTPLEAPLVAPLGERRIEARRPGYEPAWATVEVAQGGTARVQLALRPLESLPPELAATLAVRPSEPGAEVRLDGSPFALEGELPAGPHRLEVLADGFEPYVEDVDIAAGSTATVEVALRPTDAFLLGYRRRAAAFRVSAYVLGPVGVAALGTALGLFLWNDARHGEWETERDELRTYDGPDRDLRLHENELLGESIATVDGTTWGLLAVGVAAVGVGFGLFFGGPRPNRYGAVSAAPTQGGALLHLAWALP